MTVPAATALDSHTQAAHVTSEFPPTPVMDTAARFLPTRLSVGDGGEKQNLV